MRIEFLGCVLIVLACCAPAAAETGAPEMPAAPEPPVSVGPPAMAPVPAAAPAAPAAPVPAVAPVPAAAPAAPEAGAMPPPAAPPTVAPAAPPADTRQAATKPSGPSRAIPTTESVKFVPSGERRTLFFVASIFPDCSSTGKTVPRLQVKPAHGEASFVYTDGFTFFRQGTSVAHCSAIRVPGMEIQYQSAPDYLGDDSFEVLLLYPPGNAEIQRYDVIVK